MTVQWQESRRLYEDLERGSLFFSSSICLCGKEGTDPQTVCSRFCVLQAGFAGCAEDFWPKLCLRRGRRRRCGRLCHRFVPSARRTVADPSSDPAGDSLPFSKYADRHGIPSPASQVLHGIPRPVRLADPAWSPRAARGAELGGVPWGAASAMVLSLLASGHQCWEQKCVRQKVHLE